jgi:hypothetical protein
MNTTEIMGIRRMQRRVLEQNKVTQGSEDMDVQDPQEYGKIAFIPINGDINKEELDAVVDRMVKLVPKLHDGSTLEMKLDKDAGKYHVAILSHIEEWKNDDNVYDAMIPNWFYA